MDCNEPCAPIFGFNSRDELLAHSAGDFYFGVSVRANTRLTDWIRSQRDLATWPANSQAASLRPL